MQSSGSLTAVPDAIIFRGVAPNSSASIDFWVHNIGKKSVRIRLTLPFDPHFSLIGPPNVMIPPGLECKGSIRYFCRDAVEHSSALRIETPDSQITIPISVGSTSSFLRFEQTEVNMGTVPPQFTSRASFKVANCGSRSREVRLRSNDPNCRVVPKTITVDGQDEATVELECCPPKAGAFSS
jgi:hypothetical protein